MGIQPQGLEQSTGAAVGGLGSAQSPVSEMPSTTTPSSKNTSLPKKLIGGIESVLMFMFRKLRQFGSRQLLKKKLKDNIAVLAPLDADLERAHKDYWAPLGKTSGHWLRYYVNVSGIVSEKYVPGDLYYSMIDHRLNDADQNDLYNNKNNLDHLFPGHSLPDTVARKVSGVFCDANHEVCANPFGLLPSEDLILKPAFDTSSGQDVHLLRHVSGSYFLEDGSALSAEDLDNRFGDHFIIQKLVQQHEFCKQFNSASLNTFRVYTYRSVADEQVHILKMVFKMGAGDSIVDNQVAGGVVCVVRPEGCLGDYATTLDGEKRTAHPLTGQGFKGRVVPHFTEINTLASAVAKQIPSHRTLALDIALGVDGSAVLIEVNPMAAAIDLMQCDGGPLFGEFTDEVRDYCIAHPENERKKIIRP